ncbi:MAG: hypothetical protein ACOCUX_03335 [Halanaerobium sp.]
MVFDSVAAFLNKDVCAPNSAILLLEILDDIEHISDQMADIAHSIIEIYEDETIGKDESDVQVV